MFALIGHHQRNVEIVETLSGHRQADQAATVRRHEVDGFGRDLLGCDHQVAFVFAVFVIDDDDYPAVLNVDALLLQSLRMS